jgi:hypothetical protein
MKFSHMFHDLSFMRPSQFNSDTENCARCVPRMLTDGHKQNCIGAALSFLECYHRGDDEFLDHIVTGDETWVLHYTPESKCQSQEWHHAHSPTKKP